MELQCDKEMMKNNSDNNIKNPNKMSWLYKNLVLSCFASCKRQTLFPKSELINHLDLKLFLR